MGKTHSSESQSLKGKIQDEAITHVSRSARLYSKNAVKGFSLLFYPLFGTFLLMSNLSRLQKRNASHWVLLFGLSYTLLTILAVSNLGINSNFIFPLNMIGALILGELFWNKLIGKQHVHEKRRIWKPLVIALAIGSFLILANIYTSQQN